MNEKNESADTGFDSVLDDLATSWAFIDTTLEGNIPRLGGRVIMRGNTATFVRSASPQTLDVRQAKFENMLGLCMIIHEHQKQDPNIDSVIITKSQREMLVRDDPEMFAQALDLSDYLEKPVGDIDLNLIIQNCRVEVE